MRIPSSERMTPCPLLVVERQAGVLLDLQEKLCQQFEVDIDPLDELLLAEDGMHAGVLHRLDLQDAAGQVHEKRPLADRVARHADVETIEPLEQKMIAKASRRVGYRNRSMLNSSFTLTREAIRHPS